MKKIIIFVIIVVLSFSTACSSQPSKTKELSATQLDTIRRVIENKDVWKNNSGFGLTNCVYFWERGDHIYFSFGYLKGSSFGGNNFKMRCYQVDTETWKQIAVDLEQIAQWAELGARIDLDSMSDSELETSMEDVYLSFINTNPKK